ncbi:replication protein P [Rahnella sp. AN3-3W3]|uniref:replication protein P n=1 Tax=Rahnella sp. AN3-3W3 TaxID=1610578 RepID=UPI000DD3183F|nr:replication protein P [Rahnella sp. AN3-3W3]
MGEIYSDRWVAKNGQEPSSLWVQAIGSLSEAQLARISQACINRCIDGNPWAPDLAEFMSLIGETHDVPVGLSFEDVAKEFKRYCRERGYYDSAELFPWTNNNWLLYWICTSVRQRMVRYNLSEADVDKALRNEIRDWAAKLAAGEQVPAPATRIENKTRPRPAWMDLLDKKKC